MATIEKLLVQIFDRKRQIIEQLKHQKQLYEQNLLSKLLIQGIPPPPWLLNSDFQSSTSDLTGLNKEELISGLLLPRPGPFPSYPSGPCFLYDKPIIKAANSAIQDETCAVNCASSNGIDENEPGVAPLCHADGSEDMVDTVPPSNLDGTENMAGIISPYHVDGSMGFNYVPVSPDDQTETRLSISHKQEQSLARIPDETCALNCASSSGIDEDERGVAPLCHADGTADVVDAVSPSHLDGAGNMAGIRSPYHVDGSMGFNYIPVSPEDQTDTRLSNIHKQEQSLSRIPDETCDVNCASSSGIYEDEPGVAPLCHADGTANMIDAVPPSHLDSTGNMAGIILPSHVDGSMGFNYVTMSSEDQTDTRLSNSQKQEKSLARIPDETCAVTASSSDIDEDEPGVAPLCHADDTEDMVDAVPPSHLDGTENMAGIISPSHADGSMGFNYVPISGIDEDEPGVAPLCHADGTEDMADTVLPSHLDGSENMAGIISPSHVDGSMGFNYVPMSPEDQTDTSLSNSHKQEQSLARIQRSRSRQKALEFRSSGKASAQSRFGMENDVGSSSGGQISKNHSCLSGQVEISLGRNVMSSTCEQQLLKSDVSDVNEILIPEPLDSLAEDGEVKTNLPTAVFCSGRVSDILVNDQKLVYENTAGNIMDTVMAVDQCKSPQRTDGFKYSIVSPLVEYMNLSEADQTIQEFDGSVTGENTVDAQNAGDSILENTSLPELICNSESLSTPVSPFPTACKLYLAPKMYSSIPNGLLENIELQSKPLFSGRALQRKSHSDILRLSKSDVSDVNQSLIPEPSASLAEDGKVKKNSQSAVFCSGRVSDLLVNDLKVVDKNTAGKVMDPVMAVDRCKSPEGVDGFKYSIGSPLMEYMNVAEADQTRPEFEGFVIGENTVDAQNSGDNILDKTSLPELICNSASLKTPVSPFHTACKLYLAPGMYSSIPNGLLENIDPRSNLLYSERALLRKSHSDLFSFSGNQHGWDIRKPFLSPVGNGFEGITSKSGGSDKLVSSNLELTCFPILEDPESSEEDLDDAVDNCVKMTDLSMKNSAGREPPFDINVQKLSCMALDHAVENGSLESVGEDKIACSSTRNSGNKEPLGDISMPYKSSLAPDHVVECSLGPISTDGNIHEMHNDSKKSGMAQRKSRRTRLGKENEKYSVGANSSKKHTKTQSSRFSKPKLSGKSSLRSRGQSLSEKEQKLSNIVSNMKSFLPLVQQKQAAAVIPEKRDVKVKALQAAEAAKRAAEKRENERNQKKEAMKLERARVEQENMKELERKKKMKEEERKKREAENAAKKRQREEEEKKEKERKRRRVEEARLQHKQAEQKLQDWREESRCVAEDKNAHPIKDSNSGQPVNDSVVLGDHIMEDDGVHATLNNHHMSMESSAIGKLGTADMAESSTPNVDKNVKLADRSSIEQSYDISPYHCSDDEEEEEDEVPNKKFIPTWASKTSVALALSSLQHLDPDVIFPPGSFCSLDEALLPRRLPQK
ncbi:hypothetical protein BVRB_4g090500 [Beta vulgaris subsp. vulgaris]|nr:hypothetical protein BVRB_4g090500 [Beta vulgaris subsp. vulgaris]